MEPQARDYRPDAPCRRLGGQVYCSYSRGYGHRSEGVRVVKVVLFCGGLGTRIREYSEAIPKPMIPIGQEPILWHVMQYYSQYGHQDFVLCLGYKANVVKDYFLNYKQTANSDCRVSNFGKKIEIL